MTPQLMREKRGLLLSYSPLENYTVNPASEAGPQTALILTIP